METKLFGVAFFVSIYDSFQKLFSKWMPLFEKVKKVEIKNKCYGNRWLGPSNRHN